MAWRGMSAAILAGCIAIGDVATMLGVSTKTLRRWDKVGTMRPAFRTAGNHRRYDRHDVLESIRHGQAGAAGDAARASCTVAC